VGQAIVFRGLPSSTAVRRRQTAIVSATPGKATVQLIRGQFTSTIKEHGRRHYPAKLHLGIVTGGTRGIGRAIAGAILLREGAAVAVCSRLHENVQAFLAAK
jgi:hypothetical protein